MIDTRQKILDAAQKLIGEQGYGATSLRHIITEAGVNLAAIHYHFGSKEDLLDEVIARRAGPVNAERLALLDRAEAEAGSEPVPVEKILEAMLIPMAEAADRDPQFPRLMGRMIAEGMLPAVLQKHFQTVTRRVTAALRKALPGLNDEEFLWRFQFAMGAMAHTMCGAIDTLRAESVLPDFRTRITLLVTFLSGGLGAPATPARKQEIAEKAK
jgi:AcrR family transcriptional regulator